MTSRERPEDRLGHGKVETGIESGGKLNSLLFEWTLVKATPSGEIDHDS
jgi:hypothetical protein